MDIPPPSAYTQAEAYPPMEAAAADAVAALPDFPGFDQRIWTELPCSHNGVVDPAYVEVEIEYRFTLHDSGTPLVRETYLDALRAHWTALGHRILRDEPVAVPDRLDHNLLAERADGIRLWYWVAGYTVLRVQSGPVPISDHGDIEYIPPTGGIVPGSRRDRVAKYFPDGIPMLDGTIAPFDSPDSYEGSL